MGRRGSQGAGKADRQAREKEREENRQARAAEQQAREADRQLRVAELQAREKELEINRQLPAPPNSRPAKKSLKREPASLEREAELQARLQSHRGRAARPVSKLSGKTGIFQQRILDELTADRAAQAQVTTRVLGPPGADEPPPQRQLQRQRPPPGVSVMPGPLDGVNVVEFSTMIATPTAGMLLADMGASVIKVEPPWGDLWRYAQAVIPTDGRPFMAYNRGKRSMTLNLTKPDVRRRSAPPHPAGRRRPRQQPPRRGRTPGHRLRNLGRHQPPHHLLRRLRLRTRRPRRLPPRLRHHHPGHVGHRHRRGQGRQRRSPADRRQPPGGHRLRTGPGLGRLRRPVRPRAQRRARPEAGSVPTRRQPADAGDAFRPHRRYRQGTPCPAPRLGERHARRRHPLSRLAGSL